MAANIVDSINEEIYRKFKETLRNIAKLAMELYRAKTEKERQAALQKIMDEIDRMDKALDDKMRQLEEEAKRLNEQKERQNNERKSETSQDREKNNNQNGNFNDSPHQDINTTEARTWKDILPDTYEEMRQELIDNTKENIDREHNFIKVSVEQMPIMKIQNKDTKEKFISDRLDKIDIKQKIFDRATITAFQELDFFKGYENNDDWKDCISHYLEQEYENANITEYTDENGKIDYEKLLDETDIQTDIFLPLAHDMAQNSDSINELNDYIKELKEQHGGLDSMIDNIDKNRAAAVIDTFSTDDLDL